MGNNTGKKYGGRTKGTPNKTTAETKEILKTVLGRELDKLGTLLNKLEPMERVNAISKLLPYILPKQNELKAEVTIEDRPMSAEERNRKIAELKKKLEE